MKKVSVKLKIIKLQCIIIVSLSLFLVSCLSSKPVTPSQWKTDFSEVTPTLSEGYYTFPQTAVIVKVYNGSDALCIYIRFSDNQDQLKVLQNGLTVWIDPTAGKKENYGIIFSPMNLSVDESMPENKLYGLDISAMVQKLSLSPVQVNKSGIESLIDTRNFMVTYDKQYNLNYKITVPLSQLGFINTPGKIVSIGISSENKKARNGQLHDRNKDSKDEEEMGEHSSQMQGGMNGGHHSGGQSRVENSELHENEITQLKSWIKIAIATGPY
jgi:hypothetical protein